MGYAHILIDGATHGFYSKKSFDYGLSRGVLPRLISGATHGKSP